VTWKGSPARLVRAFDDAVQPLRGVERRKMFGYPAIFVNGNMVAGLVRSAMILRLGETERARFLELPGAKPFIAMKGRVMKQWAIVPPAMLESGSVLKPWLRKALAHGRSLPPKAVRRRTRPRP
jgi:TfoX/Sxy family transcriptional regulator of competence genes